MLQHMVYDVVLAYIVSLNDPIQYRLLLLELHNGTATVKNFQWNRTINHVLKTVYLLSNTNV
jgi:hypothetical protein